MSRTVAAIVLAAGQGKRFGDSPKLLAHVAGRPMIRRAVEAALGAGLSPVLVVVGHRGAEISRSVEDLPVVFVPNGEFRDGLSTSLKAGFSALPGDAEGAVILLGDMPAIGPELIRTIAESWAAAGRPDAAIPVIGQRRGNPVLLSTRLAPEIAGLRGDVGAAALLRGRTSVLEIPVQSDAVMRDVDIPEALGSFEAQPPARTTPSRIAE